MSCLGNWLFLCTWFQRQYLMCNLFLLLGEGRATLPPRITSALKVGAAEACFREWKFMHMSCLLHRDSNYTLEMQSAGENDIFQCEGTKA